MEIAIAGSGIIGLTTGLILLEHGHKVVLYTKDPLHETTSMKAAAIWFPFEAAPADKVAHWSRQTFDHYLMGVFRKLPGLKLVTLKVMDQPEEATHWMRALPQNHYQPLKKTELGEDYSHGYAVQVPMIDTSLYLPYLCQCILENGGQIINQKIDTLEEIGEDADWVINCTGLGAAKLTEDTSLYPIRGQIVKIESVSGIEYMADDHGPHALAYIIPRSDGIVLGGTAVRGDANEKICATDTAKIVQRCRGLQPALPEQISIREVIVGLRPGRSAIRLERDLQAPVIHNYGHGGSGFTVCWGCAKEVLTLVS